MVSVHLFVCGVEPSTVSWKQWPCKNRGKGKMYMYQKANTPRHSNWIATTGFTASGEADRQATSNSQKGGRVGTTLRYNYLYVFSSTVVSAFDRACGLQVCGHTCSRWCSVFALHTMGSSKVPCWRSWGRKMIVNHSHFRNNNRHLPAALPLLIIEGNTLGNEGASISRTLSWYSPIAFSRSITVLRECLCTPTGLAEQAL